MPLKNNIKSITMYKTDWCADCHRARAFFQKHKIQVIEINIDEDSVSELLVMELNNGNRTVPTIIVKFVDEKDKILVEPGFEELESVFLT